jgi:hypothetical protein
MADAASIRKQMLTREFYKRGLLINGIEVDGAVFSANNMLLFKGTFTAGPTVIAEMWIDMNNDLPALDRDARPEHLLWALLFATEYPTVLQLLARLRLGGSWSSFEGKEASSVSLAVASSIRKQPWRRNRTVGGTAQ